MGYLGAGHVVDLIKVIAVVIYVRLRRARVARVICARLRRGGVGPVPNRKHAFHEAVEGGDDKSVRAPLAVVKKHKRATLCSTCGGDFTKKMWWAKNSLRAEDERKGVCVFAHP
jgi:hypothetical protein